MEDSLFWIIYLPLVLCVVWYFAKRRNDGLVAIYLDEWLVQQRQRGKEPTAREVAEYIQHLGRCDL